MTPKALWPRYCMHVNLSSYARPGKCTGASPKQNQLNALTPIRVRVAMPEDCIQRCGVEAGWSQAASNAGQQLVVTTAPERCTPAIA